MSCTHGKVSMSLHYPIEISQANFISTCTVYKELMQKLAMLSKYPPAKPGALSSEPLKAVNGDANAAPYH